MDGKNLPQAVGEIPWGHNLQLLSKLKDPIKRLWYARMALEHGWSRNVLIHQIGTELHSRQGKAITNFTNTLPAPQSDLANQLLKDPYHLDFLAVGPDLTERRLEMALLERLKVFILELGKGFAFVGNQVHLEVGGKDYYPVEKENDLKKNGIGFWNPIRTTQKSLRKPEAGCLINPSS